VELKFVASAKPKQVEPVIQRRQKLVMRIDQQIGYVRQMIAGKPQQAAWARLDEDGCYVLPIKYGRQQIELKKGMFAVQCTDLDQVEAALCSIRTMIGQGDFDDQLAKVSAAIRAKFKART
jgi:hypothetical protein